jgi:hypothetical protein
VGIVSTEATLLILALGGICLGIGLLLHVFGEHR